MKILDLKPNTTEWLAWRRSKITGTDAGIIIGANPFSTLRDLWEDKLLMRPLKPDNDAMKRGRKLEPVALELFNSDNSFNCVPQIIESTEFEWMGSSLDGLSKGHDFICEIKCPNEDTHLSVVNYDLSGIKPYYYSQCQHNMIVSNTKRCWYISYRPEYKEQPLCIILIEYDSEYCDNLIQEEWKFYNEYLTQFFPPPDPWKFKEREKEEWLTQSSV